MVNPLGFSLAHFKIVKFAHPTIRECGNKFYTSSISYAPFKMLSQLRHYHLLDEIMQY